MKIKESTTSRKNQVVALVVRHAADLSLDNIFSPHLNFISNTPPQHCKLRIRRSEDKAGLFYDGTWDDIDIFVLDSAYFEVACEIAKEYEATSKKSVEIIKEF